MSGNRGGNQGNPSQSSSGTTGSVSAIPTGTVFGTKQAGNASTNAFEELQNKCGQKDSLLAFIGKLTEDSPEIQEDQIPAIDLSGDSRDSIHGSVKAVASVVKSVLTGATGAASHLTQTPINLTVALQALTRVTGTKDSNSFHSEALTIPQNEKDAAGFSAHCNALYNNLSQIAENLAKEVKKEMGEHGNAGLHSASALGTAGSTGAGISVTAAMIGGSLDLVGSGLREISALSQFMKKGTFQPGDKNIYEAFSNCASAFSSSQNSKDCFLALKKLENALSDFDEANKNSKDHSASSPAISVFLRSVITGGLLQSLKTFNSSAIAVSLSKDATSAKEKEISQLSKDSASRASSLKEAASHFQNSAEFLALFSEISKQVDEEIKKLPEGIGENEKSMISASAKSQLGSLANTSLVPVLFTGLLGSLVREFSAHFEESRHSNEAGNLFKIMSDCSAVFSQSQDSVKSLNALLALEKALTKSQHAKDMSQQHGVTSPSQSAFLRLVTSAPFVTALHTTVSASKALSITSKATAAKNLEIATFTNDSVARASSLKEAASHCKNSDDFLDLFSELAKQIDEEIKKLPEGVSPDERSMISFSAKSQTGTIAALSAFPVLFTGFIGSITREFSANAEELRQSKEVGNFYKALSDCSASFSQSQDSVKSLQALLVLEAALTQFEHAQKMMSERGATSPVTSAFLRLVTSSPFVTALHSTVAATKAVDILSQAIANADTGDLSKQSTVQGSSIHKDAKTHSKNVTLFSEALGKTSDLMDKAIAELDIAESNKMLLKGNAGASVSLISAASIIPQLLSAGAGLISRELHATVLHTKNQDGGVSEKWSHVTQTRTNEGEGEDKKNITGKDLDELMDRASKLKDKLEAAQKQGASAPIILGGSQVVTCGALAVSVNAFIGMCLALKEIRPALDKASLVALDADEQKDADQKKADNVASYEKSAASLGTNKASN